MKTGSHVAVSLDAVPYLFSGALCCRSRVLPASRRQIVRSRSFSFCRQDAGSTLNRYSVLNRVNNKRN